ncbi:MAG: hypothetical protein A3I72_05080 [Candidatus Tectomicrobia bacterium RIFCSPLOWO2_02_FULL_70_19]|nr:MAG: hypothetical protein A3I72_05080 [Candidatus Tectomicrobia bacterium RIFCSPLOWO2_02_FULL_70_19]
MAGASTMRRPFFRHIMEKAVPAAAARGMRASRRRHSPLLFSMVMSQTPATIPAVPENTQKPAGSPSQATAIREERRGVAPWTAVVRAAPTRS